MRGALKIMGSKVAPAGTKGWKPLVCFDKEMRTWSWIGPPPVPVASTSSQVCLYVLLFLFQFVFIYEDHPGKEMVY